MDALNESKDTVKTFILIMLQKKCFFKNMLLFWLFY